MDLRGIDKEWRGFTDLDIKKVKSETETDSRGSKSTRYPTGGPPHPSNRPPRAQQRVPRPDGLDAAQCGNQSSTLDPLAPSRDPLPSYDNPIPTLGAPEAKGDGEEEGREGVGEGNEDCTSENASTQPVATELELKESISESQRELQQKLQKEMEEENKKKKQLVEERLKERYVLSQQEAENLKKVQRELASLDQLVTRDVAVLRGKIEEANRHYDRARTRYELAEKEFVSAKLELHKSKEQKELLSEHLCAVIRETELRKSRKLSELCQALGVSDITQ